MQWPKEKGQRTNNDVQNTTQKTKHLATRTPLKSSVNSDAADKHTRPFLT
jgi:hypothetical protein